MHIWGQVCKLENYYQALEEGELEIATKTLT